MVVCCLESSVGISHQYRNVVTKEVGHHEIEDAIAIKVGHSNGLWIGAYHVSPTWREATIAEAKQHHETTLRADGHRQVQVPVAIEVADCHGSRISVSDSEVASQLKSTVSIAEKNRDTAPRCIRHC